MITVDQAYEKFVEYMSWCGFSECEYMKIAKKKYLDIQKMSDQERSQFHAKLDDFCQQCVLYKLSD